MSDRCWLNFFIWQNISIQTLALSVRMVKCKYLFFCRLFRTVSANFKYNSVIVPGDHPVSSLNQHKHNTMLKHWTQDHISHICTFNSLKGQAGSEKNVENISRYISSWLDKNTLMKVIMLAIHCDGKSAKIWKQKIIIKTCHRRLPSKLSFLFQFQICLFDKTKVQGQTCLR